MEVLVNVSTKNEAAYLFILWRRSMPREYYNRMVQGCGKQVSTHIKQCDVKFDTERLDKLLRGKHSSTLETTVVEAKKLFELTIRADQPNTTMSWSDILA